MSNQSKVENQDIRAVLEKFPSKTNEYDVLSGLFHPSKAALARLRTRLVDDPRGLSDVVTDPEFIEAFPEGIVTRKALSAVPVGFESNDPAAPYLKMVGLGCRKKLADTLLLDDDLIDLLTEIFRSARQLVRYFD